MNATLEKRDREIRPVYKFLAGLLGILFLIGVCLDAVFAFRSTGTARWHWITESALFLFLGGWFVHAAVTGRWRLRK